MTMPAPEPAAMVMIVSCSRSTAEYGSEELVRRHLLQAVGDQFDFTHERIRTAAYSQLLEPRRTLCHRRVAEALEELYASNLEPHAVALRSSRSEILK
jgi:predicted ATPase